MHLAINEAISWYLTTTFTGPEELHPAERLFVERAGKKRTLHFSTGRFCGRKALKQLGFDNHVIPPGDDKVPVWPKGVCGSISHSNHLAGALAARTDTIMAVGLDIETIGGVKQEMWNSIYDEGEQRLLNSLPEEKRIVFSTLLFSIKESFYKLQYPVTKTFLEFEDVSVTYADHVFSLQIHHPGCAALIPANRVIIYWTRFEDEVICVCWLPAGPG